MLNSQLFHAIFMAMISLNNGFFCFCVFRIEAYLPISSIDHSIFKSLAWCFHSFASKSTKLWWVSIILWWVSIILFSCVVTSICVDTRELKSLRIIHRSTSTWKNSKTTRIIGSKRLVLMCLWLFLFSHCRTSFAAIFRVGICILRFYESMND